ncbi:MAG: hypothetical protein JWM21_1373 [Acidobacteria bacterium]|nr:hypothetical protein [Acidobacteriota bacterium]
MPQVLRMFRVQRLGSVDTNWVSGAAGFISFSPGFNRVTKSRYDFPTVSTVSDFLRGDKPLKRFGGNFVAVITRLKPGENEMAGLSAFVSA